MTKKTRNQRFIKPVKTNTALPAQPNTAAIPSGGFVASEKTKSILRHHRRLVKTFPILAGLIIMASLSLYAYIFYLREQIGFKGYSFIFMLFFATIILGVGSVFIITYLSVGLGKMNQELCFINQLPADPDDTNYEELTAKEHTHLLFLLDIYKNYGRALFYPSWIICIAIGWINGVVPQLQEKDLNNNLITAYFTLIFIVIMVLRSHRKLVVKDLNNLFSYKTKKWYWLGLKR